MKLQIDPDGDVVLIVGSDESQVSLQVSSKALSLASKVFKTMLLSRNFKEGKELVDRYGPNLAGPLLPDIMTILTSGKRNSVRGPPTR